MKQTSGAPGRRRLTAPPGAGRKKQIKVGVTVTAEEQEKLTHDAHRLGITAAGLLKLAAQEGMAKTIKNLEQEMRS